MKVPGPYDPRSEPIRVFGRGLPLLETDDEALADLALLRKIKRKNGK